MVTCITKWSEPEIAKLVETWRNLKSNSERHEHAVAIYKMLTMPQRAKSPKAPGERKRIGWHEITSSGSSVDVTCDGTFSTGAKATTTTTSFKGKHAAADEAAKLAQNFKSGAEDDEDSEEDSSESDASQSELKALGARCEELRLEFQHARDKQAEALRTDRTRVLIRVLVPAWRALASRRAAEQVAPPVCGSVSTGRHAPSPAEEQERLRTPGWNLSDHACQIVAYGQSENCVDAAIATLAELVSGQDSDHIEENATREITDANSWKLAWDVCHSRIEANICDIAHGELSCREQAIRQAVLHHVALRAVATADAAQDSPPARVQRVKEQQMSITAKLCAALLGKVTGQPKKPRAPRVSFVAR